MAKRKGKSFVGNWAKDADKISSRQAKSSKDGIFSKSWKKDLAKMWKPTKKRKSK